MQPLFTPPLKPLYDISMDTGREEQQKISAPKHVKSFWKKEFISLAIENILAEHDVVGGGGMVRGERGA